MTTTPRGDATAEKDGTDGARAPTAGAVEVWRQVAGGGITSSTGFIIAWVYADIECGRANDDYYSCRNAKATPHLKFRPESLPMILAAPELLAACKAQHNAIDILMAHLIELDPTFLPSKSRIWPMLLQGNAAIAKAYGQVAEGSPKGVAPDPVPNPSRQENEHE